MKYVISLLVVVMGCKAPGTPPVDADGDGYAAVEDCDDDNASINPGADELCDNVDQNCNGQIDEGLLGTYYADTDADGYGDASTQIQECARPTGYVEDSTDCDDTVATANPGVTAEICDDIDHNCDGDAYAGAPGGDVYWPDVDGDGFGEEVNQIRSCQNPGPGYILFVAGAEDDCNDTDAAISPGADELCATTYDDDCDGLSNEADAVDGDDYPVDFDGDGRGSVIASTCFVGSAVDTDGDGIPDGVTVETSLGGDCDDTNNTVAPHLPELCDGLDNDCDVLTDENLTAIDRETYYVDVDGDGTGDPADSVLACSQPGGYVSSSIPEDCNDGDPDVLPGVAELCDGIDNNCDGSVDDSTSIDAVAYYNDLDSDTFGDALGAPAYSCSPIVGLVDNNFDCDDQDDTVGQAELRYPDFDGDGYGDPSQPAPSCNAPAGFVNDNTDCDDMNVDVNPTNPWYADTDLDGFGDLLTEVLECIQPAGYVDLSTDCDDTDPATNPDALEDLCDGEDNDCDTAVDEDCVVEHCGVISTAEVWGSERVHLVTCDVSVQGPGASLTIEDGSEVRFQADTRLRVGVGLGGTLSVVGGATGVLMAPESDVSPELWGGVEIGRFSTGNFLSGLEVRGAGTRGYGIELNGTDAILDDVQVLETEGVGIEVFDSTFEATDLTVQESTEIGLALDGQSTLVSLSNSTFTLNAGEPVQLPFRYVELLDDNNSFAGNGVDEIVLLGDDVIDDLAVPVLTAPFRIAGDVNIGGGGAPELTVSSGVEMRFEPGAGLIVGDGAQGSINVAGTTWDDVAGSVLMAGSTPTPGSWDGLKIGPEANASTLTGLEITQGGGNNRGNIWMEADGNTLPDERPLMTLTDVRSAESSNSGLLAAGAKVGVFNSQFDNNLTYGAQFIDVVLSDSDIDGSTFQDNSLSGAQVDPYLVELLTNNSYTGNVLPIEVRPGAVTDSAVWEPLSEDYYVTGLVEVGDAESPELTIVPGTTVYFGANGRFNVGFGDQGSILIEGDATTGVLFSSLTEYQGLPTERGSYPGLEIGGLNRVSTLRGLTIRYAGSTSAAILLSGDGENPIEIADTVVEQSGGQGLFASGTRLNVHDSQFLDNDDEGVFLQGTTRLIDLGGRSFANNVISGNGKHAMRLPADSLGQLDDSSTFSGNNLITGEPDRISIAGNVLTPGQTWVALDANYWMNNGSISIGGPANPVVTIEAGAVFEVEAGTNNALEVARIGESGGIIANSNGGANIVFTSDGAWDNSAFPGDWRGIYIGADCLQVDGGPPGPSRCILDGVQVDYAGSFTEEGALLIEERRSLPYAQPLLMQNMTVRYSATTGIQFQARGGIVSPNPDPAVDMGGNWDAAAQFYSDTTPYPAACEGDPTTAICANFDYCYDGVNHGTNNLICGNGEANVGVRNFANPFIWVTCPIDGPVGTTSCP